MAKLDVELGKAVGIQRTKAGSGDKEEAFLIRGTLLKFAGAFCLIFLIVGGLAIFLSQWEVTFQQGINLDERVEHEAIEQASFTQFMQIGNLLTSFLRGETHKKQIVDIVQVEVDKAVEALVASMKTASSSDEVQSLVEAFGDKVYAVLDEYSEMVVEESTEAKKLLGTLNNIMAADNVMPESREKIRPVKGTNSLQRVKGGVGRKPGTGNNPKGPNRPDRGGPAAQAKLAALGGDLNAIVDRVFKRTQLLSALSFPDDFQDRIVALQHSVSGAVQKKEDLTAYLVQFRNLLSTPGVRGIDSDTIATDRQMIIALKEMVQLFPVLDHVSELEELKLKYEAQEVTEGEVMHVLHKMARSHILPFEWVAPGQPFGVRKPKAQKGGRGGSGLFAQPTKYQWWHGLGEE